MSPSPIQASSELLTEYRAEIERLRKVLAIEGLSCKVAADIEHMRAEIERLQREKADECVAKMLWNQKFVVLAERIDEAAAFLDGLAERLSPRELETGTQGMFDRMAADCRAMARKLRGET